VNARRTPGKLVVGLTGGIGSGKSAAAQAFADLGAAVVDTDAIAHELTETNGPAIPQIEAIFGKEFILPSGAMNRERMRERVFSDPAARKALQRVLHPMIREESARRIAAATSAYVIHVVPLLVESPDYRERVDRVLVIDCPESVQIERVRARGLPEPQVRAIIASQASREARLAAADDVIENSATLDALRKQVAQLHAQYIHLRPKPTP
jgi:dephospho-CoA kinase